MLSIAKVTIRDKSPEEVAFAERNVPFRRGVRMHHFDGGVLIDYTVNSRNEVKWWAIKDHVSKRRAEHAILLTEEYFYQTYELPEGLKDVEYLGSAE